MIRGQLILVPAIADGGTFTAPGDLQTDKAVILEQFFKTFEDYRVGGFLMAFQEFSCQYAVELAAALMKAREPEVYLSVETTTASFVFRKLQLLVCLYKSGNSDIGRLGEKQWHCAPAGIQVEEVLPGVEL